MRVHKPSAFTTQSQPISEESDTPSSMPLPLATIVLHGTSEVSRSVPTPLTIYVADTTSMLPSYSEYRLTLENFVKMVKAPKKFEWQLNIYTKEFKPFVDRVIADALKPYEKLHTQIDNVEKQVKNRL